jgi:hypothetical protein
VDPHEVSTYPARSPAALAPRTNLKKNKTLFKNRQKGEDIELSGAGMKKAAGLIKTLASES